MASSGKKKKFYRPNFKIAHNIFFEHNKVWDQYDSTAESIYLSISLYWSIALSIHLSLSPFRFWMCGRTQTWWCRPNRWTEGQSGTTLTSPCRTSCGWPGPRLPPWPLLEEVSRCQPKLSSMLLHFETLQQHCCFNPSLYGDQNRTAPPPLPYSYLEGGFHQSWCSTRTSTSRTEAGSRLTWIRVMAINI